MQKNRDNPDTGATLDDLRKRGVKKVSVFTPEKVREMVRQRAVELMEKNKASILEKTQEKIRPLVAQNRQYREKIDGLNAQIETSRRLLENERSKSFREGTETQKAVLERYQDEMLSLKTRVKELEIENGALLRQTNEQTRDILTKYREQIALLAEDIRQTRTQPAAVETPIQNSEIIKEFQDELKQIRQQISAMHQSETAPASELRTVVAEMEKNIAARLRQSAAAPAAVETTRQAVPPKDIILDNLFKNMPESNIASVKVRQDKGKSISGTLDKLKGFHEGREDLEISGTNND